ncbi:hypothetical protein [Serratia fonticola]|uniref:hypothetical protein n=1 Tax=Serratia fonticola TaxID=47917 RepID=UPI0021AD52B1|nr:hypothetical protein [Serratia fonticola]
MSRSQYTFKRWKPQSNSSWAWTVFKKHSNELLRMHIAFHNSFSYTYSNLKSNGANWQESPDIHFDFYNQRDIEKFTDLKNWSDSYNQLENWVNLNALVAILSNFETYIATIVPVAIESDIGILYGIPNKIDGIELLKHNKKKPRGLDEIIMSCTKGTWGSRVNAYKDVFDNVPDFLVENISELDKMRNLRNNVAHAFGRDIDASRERGTISIIPSEKLSRIKLLRYQSIVWRAAKKIDEHLYKNHIGEYLRLKFFHKLYPSLNQSSHPSEKAIRLKKEIGRFGDVSAGKEFCKGLVSYYESL